MSTLKTNKIENVAGDVGYDVGASFSFRNKIINGGFDIWQRNAGSPTFVAPVNNFYSADRWFITTGGTGGNGSVTREPITPTDASIIGYGKYYYKHEITLAPSGQVAGNNYIETRIEDVETLSGETATVSFWMKGSGTLPSINLVQNFGSGGSVSKSYTLDTDIVMQTGWTKYSFTVTLDDLTAQTVGTSSFLSFVILLPLNTTYSISIAKVQLEEGTVATPFEERHISLEELMCKRYYESLGQLKHSLPGNNTLTTVQFSMMPRVTKRTTGTLTIDNITLLNATNLISLGGGPNVYTVEWTLDATTNQCYALFSAYVNAEL